MAVDPEAIAKLRPELVSSLDALTKMLDGGLDLASPEVRAYAERCAEADERHAYRENGRPTDYVGGAVRCAAAVELLIRRGLPQPASLLRLATASPEVVDVLLRLAPPARDEVDAALLAACNESSFDPILPVLDRLLAAGPSAAAIDEALRRAASGAARYVGIAIDLVFLDVLYRLLIAGGHADHGAGTATPALHHLMGFALPNTHGDAKLAQRGARVDELTVRAIASVRDIDAVDALGRTALHWACVNRSPARIAMLIAAGADRERPDAQGLTPVDCATPARLEDVFAALGVALPPAPPPRSRGRKPRPVPVAAPPDPFPIGARVSHPKFGEGAVTASQGEGAGRKLTIEFAGRDKRVLAASFVARVDQKA